MCVLEAVISVLKYARNRAMKKRVMEGEEGEEGDGGGGGGRG